MCPPRPGPALQKQQISITAHPYLKSKLPVQDPLLWQMVGCQKHLTPSATEAERGSNCFPRTASDYRYNLKRPNLHRLNVWCNVVIESAWKILQVIFWLTEVWGVPFREQPLSFSMSRRQMTSAAARSKVGWFREAIMTRLPIRTMTAAGKSSRSPRSSCATWSGSSLMSNVVSC